MRFLQHSVIVIGIGVYLWCLFYETPVDIRTLSPETLSEIIRTNEKCDVADVGDTIFLRNDTFNLEILKCKTLTFFNKKRLWKYFREQFYCAHLISETIMEKRFAITLIFAGFSTALINFFVIRRTGSLVRNRIFVENLEDTESVFIGECARNFLLEKLAVLILSVTRTEPPIDNKVYADFGEYMRESVTIRSRATDVTFFGCWFLLLSIVHVNTNTIWFRYKKMVPVFERSQIAKLHSDQTFLIFFTTLSLLTALSAFIFIVSIPIFYFLNPLYALVLVLESFRAFLQTTYVVNRMAICMRKPEMSAFDARRETMSEQQIVDFILSSGVEFRPVYEKMTRVVSLTLYNFYALLGVTNNSKALAIGFLFGTTHNMDYLYGEKFMDLNELL